jgi:hypothetical protein
MEDFELLVKKIGNRQTEGFQILAKKIGKSKLGGLPGLPGNLPIEIREILAKEIGNLREQCIRVEPEVFAIPFDQIRLTWPF